MIVSTKGRYALRVMVELAQHQGDGSSERDRRTAGHF
jgi:DNA-binding IscR family transcriptional regulator